MARFSNFYWVGFHIDTNNKNFSDVYMKTVEDIEIGEWYVTML